MPLKNPLKCIYIPEGKVLLMFSSRGCIYIHCLYAYAYLLRLWIWNCFVIFIRSAQLSSDQRLFSQCVRVRHLVWMCLANLIIFHLFLPLPPRMEIFVSICAHACIAFRDTIIVVDYYWEIRLFSESFSLTWKPK